jgi:hypothetical protein
MKPRGHHFFQAFEHARPGECLALDQLIQKLRLIAGSAVFGAIEELLGADADLIAIRDESALFGDGVAVAPGVDPAGQVQYQEHQGQQPDYAHRRAPAHPELPRVFIRPAREIDV